VSTVLYGLLSFMAYCPLWPTYKLPFSLQTSGRQRPTRTLFGTPKPPWPIQRVPALAELEMLQTGHAIREMSAQLGHLPEWL
jgi:hypothetical protein